MLAMLSLWLGGLSLLAFGLAFVIDPLATMGMAGIQLDGPVAATELRAFYGGLEVALGALLIACALKHDWRRAGLLLSLVVFAGIGLGRALGLLIAHTPTAFLWTALGTELGLAALSAFALMRTKKLVN
jgi:Domain of unknown function (DUF4345)